MTRKALRIEDLTTEEIARIEASQVDADMAQIYDDLMDVDDDIDNLPSNCALHRAGATVMRRNSFADAEIIEHYGYLPESIIG